MNTWNSKGMWLLFGFAIILNSITTVVLLSRVFGDSTIQKQSVIMPPLTPASVEMR